MTKIINSNIKYSCTLIRLEKLSTNGLKQNNDNAGLFGGYFRQVYHKSTSKILNWVFGGRSISQNNLHFSLEEAHTKVDNKNTQLTNSDIQASLEEIKKIRSEFAVYLKESKGTEDKKALDKLEYKLESRLYSNSEKSINDEILSKVNLVAEDTQDENFVKDYYENLKDKIISKIESDLKSEKSGISDGGESLEKLKTLDTVLNTTIDSQPSEIIAELVVNKQLEKPDSIIQDKIFEQSERSLILDINMLKQTQKLTGADAKSKEYSDCLKEIQFYFEFIFEKNTPLPELFSKQLKLQLKKFQNKFGTKTHSEIVKEIILIWDNKKKDLIKGQLKGVFVKLEQQFIELNNIKIKSFSENKHIYNKIVNMLKHNMFGN